MIIQQLPLCVPHSWNDAYIYIYALIIRYSFHCNSFGQFSVDQSFHLHLLAYLPSSWLQWCPFMLTGNSKLKPILFIVLSTTFVDS